MTNVNYMNRFITRDQTVCQVTRDWSLIRQLNSMQSLVHDLFMTHEKHKTFLLDFLVILKRKILKSISSILHTYWQWKQLYTFNYKIWWLSYWLGCVIVRSVIQFNPIATGNTMYKFWIVCFWILRNVSSVV